ncbi:MAG: amidinotransferase [bacterium]|jgi:N-dimethylarginine dimethylaminohydrolase
MKSDSLKPSDRTGISNLLMCEPTSYDLVYEINVWMRVTNKPDKRLALQQWNELFRVLQDEVGASISLIPQQTNCPDMVFTANAGIAIDDRVIISRFRNLERRLEEPFFSDWFNERQYKVETLPNDAVFEGEGDALFVGDTLVAGYLKRSEISSHRKLAEMLGCRVLSLELVDDRWYHLDTCFLPLDEHTVVYYPGAFDSYGRRVINENFHAIPIELDEALHFACNSVVIGNHIVMPSGCPNTAWILRDRGREVHPVPMTEFIKSGGACKCLTLYLPK